MESNSFNINTNITKLPLVFDHFMRNKVYNSRFWKEKLAGINEEELIDIGMRLKYIGGGFGPYKKPCKFLSIILKMLHMDLDKDIVLTMINNPNYKYLTALGLFYLRIISESIYVYIILEQFYKDFRKLNFINSQTCKSEIIHIDEYVHNLLNNDYYCNLTLPRLISRDILIDQGNLKEREFSKEILEENDT